MSADVRELRLLMKDWRSGRATRTLWEAIQDGYVLVLTVVILGAMLINLLVKAQGDAATCVTAGCVSARSLLPYATWAACVALAVATARLFGPVLASAAEGFWLLDAPIDRAALLRRRLIAGVVLAGVLGAGLTALIAALTGVAGAVIGLWAAAGGLSASAVVAFAAVEQTAERGWTTRVAVWLFTLIAVAALGAVVGIAAGWFTMPAVLVDERAAASVIAGVGGVVTVAMFAVAWLRLDRIRRTRLVSGGALVSGMAGAMYALDLGLARDIVVDRRAREIGHVRPRRGSGTGIDALIRRDLSRLMRTPQAFLPSLATVVIPYACASLGFGRWLPLVSGLALFGALIPLLGTLRVLTRTVGLARCLPFSEDEVRRASLAVAAGVAMCWGLFTVPSFRVVAASEFAAIPTAMVTAVAGLLGAVRWTAAKPVDYGAPMLATQAGAMPPGMVANMVKGFDMVAIVTAPLIFGFDWWISAILALICYGFAMGNFDLERLQEQQEESKRQLALAREEAKGRK